MSSDSDATHIHNGSGPEVSVLVPSYNSGAYVEQAIRSALDQDTVEVEVVVQDGGSTDGTLEVLEGFDDPRLRYVSEADAGQADALNRALRRASGEFVVWLNADDLLMPGAAEALLQAARDRNLDVVSGDFEIIDSDGSLIKAYMSAPLERRRLIRHGTYIFSGTLLIRRTLLIDVGAFDPNLHYCMDYELMLRLAERQEATGNIAQTVAQFRRQPDSKTESGWLPVARELYATTRTHGGSWFATVWTLTVHTAYYVLRPIWRSRVWLRVRPRKRLGGA